MSFFRVQNPEEYYNIPDNVLDSYEDKCLYVSCRGLARICDNSPLFDCKDGFSITHYKLNSKKGDTYYIPFDALKIFIYHVLDKIQEPIVLVVGHSDLEFPNNFLDIFLILLQSEKLLKIYMTNSTFKNDKIIPLPYGLSYHTLSYNMPWKSWGENNVKPIIQERDLLYIKSTFRPLSECKPLCATNFQHTMDMPNRERFRLTAYNILKNNPCVKWYPVQTRKEYFKSMDEYAFYIAPPGNGLDTVRLWETLVLGRIPITFNSGLLAYEDLPVILVTDWNIITEEWLKIKHQEILNNLKENKYNMEKLLLSYWKQKFDEFKE